MTHTKNFESPRTGKAIANQFIISGLSGTKLMDNTEIKSGTMFQSYESNIAYIQYDGAVFLDARYWDYSKTTGKYRNIFLGETKKETEAKIESGLYKLVDLN